MLMWPLTARVSEYVCDLEYLFSRMNVGSYGATEPHLWLMSKISTRTRDDCRATSERKSWTHSYDDLVNLLIKLAPERENDSHTVRTPEEVLTNDPEAVLQAVMDSFQAQHGDALPELDSHTRNTICEHVPRVFNREQRRAIEYDPFSISELQPALDRLKEGVLPGVDGLPAEAYQRLTLPVKRRLAARLWDIVTGATPIPPEWANMVHPLYKNGTRVSQGTCRP